MQKATKKAARRIERLPSYRRARGDSQSTCHGGMASCWRASAALTSDVIYLIEDFAPEQMLDHALGEGIRRLPMRLQVQVRIFRYFVRLIDAGEVFDLAGERTAIEPFRIAGDALLNWRVHKYFD